MKVAHLADIQIRAHSRHDEYRESFNILEASLSQRHHDAIVVAGDILHHKTSLSPEAVDVCVDFFTMLTQHASNVYVILGNHDMALNNKTRLNSLEPIVKAINANDEYDGPRRSGHLQLLDETDVFWCHNCCWLVMSIQDDAKRWNDVKKEAINRNKNTGKPIIGLWHGTVNGILGDNGQPLQSPHDISMFEGLDYVMLGDIHKHQILDVERRVAYPGSYPQQSYGESREKGYLLWDIKDKDTHTLEFVQLPLVHPFYTFNHTDVLDADVQKRSRIRVRCNNLSKLEQKELAERARKRHEAIEVKIVDDTPAASSVEHAMPTEHLRSRDTQESLLLDYVKDLDFSAAQKMRLLNLNAESNNLVPSDDVVRNVRYQIKSLKFNNLFSFAENNTLDFTKLQGIIGIQGKNRCGKSSLAVDVPMYTLYNKISKPSLKNQSYVNQNKDSCDSEIEIEMDGKQYKIARTTKIQRVKKKNGSIEEKSATSVEFTVDGKCSNALDRADTDKEIRKVFGTAEDFINTTVAPQFDLLGFVADKATDRKKTIGRYFDLDMFEVKHEYAKKHKKAIVNQLESLALTDHEQEAQLLTEQCNSKQQEKTQAIQRREYLQERCNAVEIDIANIQAPQADPIEAEIFKLKTRMRSAKERAQSLYDDLESMKQYDCLSNANCCMHTRYEEIEQQKKHSDLVLQNLYDEAHALVARKKEQQGNTDSIQALKELQQERAKVRQELDIVRVSIARIDAFVESAKFKQTDLARQQEKVKELKNQLTVSSAFEKAMSKDGISFQIIKNNLSIINNAIAKLLDNNTDFKIWLQDDDKEIGVYFQEHNGKCRTIELCSGMEKTMAAVVIRAALISVTSLPVSNVFILDESLVALDTENMESMGRILDSLKDLFQTILLICHDEYIRDLCDDVLLIERDEQASSRIQHQHG